MVFISFIFLQISSPWSEPVNISNTPTVNSALGNGFAMDKYGYLHCAFPDSAHDGSAGTEIYYVFFNGTEWSHYVNISHSPTLSSWGPAIATDSFGNVHITWEEYETGKIMWTMKTDTGFSTPIPISGSVSGSQASSIAHNPVDNTIHCVWHSIWNGHIWHSFFNGDSWSTPVDVTPSSIFPDDCAWADIAFDSLGRLHLVFMNYVNNIQISYGRKTGEKWEYWTDVSNLTSGYNEYPAIAIDSINNVHIVWQNTEKIYYRYFDGENWSPRILLPDYPCYYPDIAIDGNGRKHIVWSHFFSQSSGIPYYTILEDTQMIIPIESIGTVVARPFYPHLLIDTGFVHCVWYDYRGNNGDMFYSRRILYVGITDERVIFDKSIFPSICFKLNISQGGYLRIYDIRGVKVFEKKINKAQEISLSFLPAGIYFPCWETRNKKYITKIVYFK
uniref:T9SS type A sorting domain-containing protein n=1 Tax=candidate division WOR-3 bacterium TaxID=2052148 RepID=A0A7C4U6Z1_UNCW3